MRLGRRRETRHSCDENAEQHRAQWPLHELKKWIALDQVEVSQAAFAAHHTAAEVGQPSDALGLAWQIAF